MAPIEVAASIRAMVSGRFGIIAATRSPTPMPLASMACCSCETSACSASKLMRARTLSSPRNTRASPGPVLRRRFSAKLSVASGKKRASVMWPSSTSARSPFNPITPQTSQTALQNAPRSATDQA